MKGLPIFPENLMLIVTGSVAKSPPNIVASGNFADSRDRAMEEPCCLELGATAYVRKSTDFNTYFGSVQAILRKWIGRQCSSSHSSAPFVAAFVLPALAITTSMLRLWFASLGILGRAHLSSGARYLMQGI